MPATSAEAKPNAENASSGGQAYVISSSTLQLYVA